MDNKEKVNKVIEEIKSVIPDFGQFDCINCGGCGVFAYLLWKRLREIGIEDITCYPITYDDSDVEELNTAFIEITNGKDPHERDAGFSHIILSIDSVDGHYLIDSEGIEHTTDDLIGTKPMGHLEQGWLDDDDVLGEPIPFDMLEKLAFDTRPGLWNDDFDRKQIPDIDRVIHEIAPV